MTMLGVMFAEAYSSIIGKEVHESTPLTNAQRWQTIRESLPITYGVIIPVIFFAASWAGVIQMDQAYRLARTGLIVCPLCFWLPLSMVKWWQSGTQHYYGDYRCNYRDINRKFEILLRRPLIVIYRSPVTNLT